MFKKLITSMIAASLALSAATPAIASAFDGKSAEEFRTTLSAECYATKNTGGINKTELTCYDKAWIDYWRADDNSGRMGDIVWLRVGDDLVTITTKEIREGGKDAIEAAVVNHIVTEQIEALEEAVEELAEMQQRLDNLEAALEAAGLDHDQIVAGLEAAYAEEVANLTSEHAKLMLAQSEAHAEAVADMQADLDAKIADLNNTVAQLEAANTKVAELESQLATAQENLAASQADNTALQLEVDTLTADLATANATVDSLNAKVTQLTTDLDNVSYTVTVLGTNIEITGDTTMTIELAKNGTLKINGEVVGTFTEHTFDAGYSEGKDALEAYMIDAAKAYFGEDFSFDSYTGGVVIGTNQIHHQGHAEAYIDAVIAAAVDQAESNITAYTDVTDIDSFVAATATAVGDVQFETVDAVAPNIVGPGSHVFGYVINYVHIDGILTAQIFDADGNYVGNSLYALNNDSSNANIVVARAEANGDILVATLTGTGGSLSWVNDDNLSITNQSDVAIGSEGMTINGHTLTTESGIIDALKSPAWSAIVDIIEDAYEFGYEDGYSDGYADGYVDGYNDGYEAGVNSVGG